MLSRRSSFNMEFWLLTLGLLLFWTLVLSTSTASATSAVAQRSQRHLRSNNANKPQMHERNCKSLCKQCGCMGFYCGEECICECNNPSAKTGTECLAGMRSEATKRRIPFQLLIQGPSRNRFIRKAIEYNHKIFGVSGGPAARDLKRRSSVLIYKPVASPNFLRGHSSSVVKRSNTNKGLNNKRLKRSVGHLEWFSDFANTLVRPAPLGGKRRATKASDYDETVAQSHFKRAANKQEMDRSWFSDSSSLLLRPSPLFKKQRSNAETVGTPAAFANSKDEEVPFEAPIRAMGNFPKVLQDTLRNLQETTIGRDAASEFGDTLRNHIQEGANVLQSQFSDGNLELLPRNGALRENLQQTFSQFFTPNNDESPRTQTKQQQRSTLPRMMPRNFNWFRPVRFLQRVQQAIN